MEGKCPHCGNHLDDGPEELDGWAKSLMLTASQSQDRSRRLVLSYVPREMLERVIRMAHDEGIGPRRLANLMPISWQNVSLIRSEMGLPRLPTSRHPIDPSPELATAILELPMSSPFVARLNAVIERAYDEGIGAHQLSKLIPRNAQLIGLIRAQLGLPKIEASDEIPRPSDELRRLIADLNSSYTKGTQ